MRRIIIVLAFASCLVLNAQRPGTYEGTLQWCQSQTLDARLDLSGSPGSLRGVFSFDMVQNDPRPGAFGQPRKPKLVTYSHEVIQSAPTSPDAPFTLQPGRWLSRKLERDAVFSLPQPLLLSSSGDGRFLRGTIQGNMGCLQISLAQRLSIDEMARRNASMEELFKLDDRHAPAVFLYQDSAPDDETRTAAAIRPIEMAMGKRLFEGDQCVETVIVRWTGKTAKVKTEPNRHYLLDCRGNCRSLRFQITGAGSVLYTTRDGVPAISAATANGGYLLWDFEQTDPGTQAPDLRLHGWILAATPQSAAGPGCAYWP